MYTGCATARSHFEYNGNPVDETIQCDCWVDAYKGIFGKDPHTMTDQFKTCTNVASSSSDNTNTDGTDDQTPGDNTDSTNTGPICCDGSTATGGPPPVCDDGSNALPPGSTIDDCPETDPVVTDGTTAAADDETTAAPTEDQNNNSAGALSLIFAALVALVY